MSQPGASHPFAGWALKDVEGYLTELHGGHLPDTPARLLQTLRGQGVTTIDLEAGSDPPAANPVIVRADSPPSRPVDDTVPHLVQDILVRDINDAYVRQGMMTGGGGIPVVVEIVDRSGFDHRVVGAPARRINGAKPFSATTATGLSLRKLLAAKRKSRKAPEN